MYLHSEAISGRDSPSLAGFVVLPQRCHFSGIALLCALRAALIRRQNQPYIGRLFSESALVCCARYDGIDYSFRIIYGLTLLDALSGCL